MATTSRGVRSVNEKLIQSGRALLITDITEDGYDWADIPAGSIFVNSKTGALSVKTDTSSNWVPLADLIRDGQSSLIIARDGKLVTEVLQVIKIDNTNNEIQYESKDGRYRYGNIVTDTVSNTKMYVLELLDGSYLPRRNQITLTINDTLERTAASGGLVELTNRKIGILDELQVGDELTVTYYMRIMIGNPFPRVYMSEYLPDNPEEGDFWLDLTEPETNTANPNPNYPAYRESVVLDTTERYIVGNNNG